MATTASPRVVLALIVLTCVLMSILGLGIFPFGDDSSSQLLELSWIGPLLALPALGLIAISRKAVVSVGFALLVVNYLGSLALMNGECALGHCLATHNSILGFAQVTFGSVFTPQSGLSLILLGLAFVYQRSARSQVSHSADSSY